MSIFEKNPFMKQCLCLFIGFIISVSAFNAQNEVPFSRLDSAQFPSGIRNDGNAITDAITWNDKDGQHLLVMTATGIYNVGDGFMYFVSSKVFGYHYLVKDKKVTPSWRVKGVIEGCADTVVEVKFFKELIRVTDLNNDGFSEVWIPSKTLCGQSQVNSHEIRIEMHQKDKMLVIHGGDNVRATENDYRDPGTYKMWADEEPIPQVYSDFAIALWNRVIGAK
jgi:hypothetical protein